MRHYSGIEINIHNALVRNKGHLNCPLIMKESYKEFLKIGLYCAKHDHYIKWLSYDEREYLIDNGIQLVVQPYGGNDHAHGLFDYYRDLKKTVKVKNLRTGKRTEILESYHNDLYRDPSLQTYWDNIDKYT